MTCHLCASLHLSERGLQTDALAVPYVINKWDLQEQNGRKERAVISVLASRWQLLDAETSQSSLFFFMPVHRMNIYLDCDFSLCYTTEVQLIRSKKGTGGDRANLLLLGLIG